MSGPNKLLYARDLILNSQGEALEHTETSIIIGELTPIWQSVLQRSPIGVEDNFFELGGNPSLAVKLFDQIAAACGREMPPLTIYHAPTITDLAGVLQQPSLPRFSPLVPLKRGEEDSPVFIAPGVGGSVMEFFRLVGDMQTRRAIYGLQALAADGGDAPFERIEDMAQFYLEAIQERQPHGPYLLVGYSLGGLVALEIAQRLSAKGEQIGLLSLLDAYPYKSFLEAWQQVRRMVRLTRHHASIVKRLPLRKRLSYVLDPAERTLHAPCKGSEELVRAPFLDSMRQARDSGRLALTRYQPRPYAGKIRFVKAGEKSVFPVDPVAAWRKWMSALAVETVPGNHYAMLSEHFDSLASALSRYLQEAS